MGQIIHGNKNFGYAPLQIEDGSVKGFGTPVMIPGLVSVSIETEQSDTNIYADDTVYATIKGAKLRTGKANFRKIPNDYVEYMGFKKQANGGFADTGTYAAHCIFFETNETDSLTGENTPTLHYIYTAQCAEPSVSTSTDEDSVEAASLEVSYTSITNDYVKDADGNTVQYFKITRSESNKNLYDAFKTKVILPTDVA